MVLLRLVRIILAHCKRRKREAQSDSGVGSHATTEPRSLSERMKKRHRALKDEPRNYGTEERPGPTKATSHSKMNHATAEDRVQVA